MMHKGVQAIESGACKGMHLYGTLVEAFLK